MGCSSQGLHLNRHNEIKTQPHGNVVFARVWHASLNIVVRLMIVGDQVYEAHERETFKSAHESVLRTRGSVQGWGWIDSLHVKSVRSITCENVIHHLGDMGKEDKGIRGNNENTEGYKVRFHLYFQHARASVI